MCLLHLPNNLLATLPQTQPQAAALENNERTLEDWEEDAFAKLEKKKQAGRGLMKRPASKTDRGHSVKEAGAEEG